MYLAIFDNVKFTNNKNNITTYYTTLLLNQFGHKISFCFIFLSIGFIILNSCKVEENTYNNLYTIVEVNNDIDTTTFWFKNRIYIIKKEKLIIRSLLMIEKGTTIKFDPLIKPMIYVIDSGQISVQGTTTYPVVFTSLYDDKHDGDTNKDGIRTKPSVGDWGGIIIRSTSFSSINNAQFYYSGGNENLSTITIDHCNAEIRYCLFANNRGGNIEKYSGVVNAQTAGITTRISYNIFYHNDLPLVINTSLSLDNSNRFYNPTDTSMKNKYNIIIIDAREPVMNRPFWSENEVPFVIQGNMLKIEDDNACILGNNVTLKFLKNAMLWIESPEKSIINIDGRGVVLTSIFDDKRKGDSNADGSFTTPSDGDWNIYIKNNTNLFNWKNVYYAKLINDDK